MRYLRLANFISKMKICGANVSQEWKLQNAKQGILYEMDSNFEWFNK